MKTKITKYKASTVFVPFISTAITDAGDILYTSTDISLLLQLEAFRALKPYTHEEELVEGFEEHFLVDNFRPVQELNGRTVRRNFEDEEEEEEDDK